MSLDTLFLALPFSFPQAGETGVTEIIIELLIQLAVILFVAKIAGEIATRFLKLPVVLAELTAGVLIGPFALGGIDIPRYGQLFPIPIVDGVRSPIPVSNELFSLAQIGSIFLLFAIGLETNLRQFLRYAGPATAVAAGGVILPFVLGAGATALMGFDGVHEFTAPAALFMGAIMTATSVGITARVLAELNRLDSPEGVTVLAAAVVDDVLGILVLTVVVGVSAAGGFSVGSVGWVAFKAIGFWLGLTAVGILAAPHIERIINRLHVSGAGLVLTVALALLAAGMAETFGLAFIIGAFSIGLALSTTNLGHRVNEEMIPITQVVVPVFFVVMGMLVDVRAMLNPSALTFGLIISALAVVSKLFGSGVPAMFSGFNLWGSTRVGVGMMPRGEVALIIAGIGLAQGLVGPGLFGVSIMMTVVTTLIAPILLIPLFRMGGGGVRSAGKQAREADAPSGAQPLASVDDPADDD